MEGVANSAQVETHDYNEPVEQLDDSAANGVMNAFLGFGGVSQYTRQAEIPNWKTEPQV